MVFFCLLFLTMWGGQTQSYAESHSPVFTKLSEVRNRSLEDGAKAFPVHAQAVVTYSDPDWRVTFIEDETGPVFLELPARRNDPQPPLQRGQFVDVEGITANGMVHCNVRAQQIKVLGTRPLPAARHLGRNEIVTNEHEGHYVRVSGWVAALGVLGDRITMELVLQPGNTLTVVIPKLNLATAESFRGCFVEIPGIVALKLSGRRLTGEYLLFVNDISEVHKLKSLPIISVSELLSPDFHILPYEPVRVGGKVEGDLSGKELVLSDGTNTVQVLLNHRIDLLLQTDVDVFAYPLLVDKKIVLSKAIIKEPFRERTAPDLSMPPGPNPRLRKLTRIAQVRGLSPTEAAKGYPVNVSGVVTYCDAPSYELYIQDETAGIFIGVNTLNNGVPLVPGATVEIDGFSGPGEYAPVIHATQIRTTGNGSFPTPHATTVPLMMTGVEDSQWVTLKGVVRSQTVVSNQHVLVLATGDSLVKVRLPNGKTIPGSLNFVDTAVEVSGVCKTMVTNHRRLAGIELHVPDMTQINIKELPLIDPFELPARAINELSQFHSGNSGLHRTCLQGRVTLRQLDGSFYLQDETGGILVQPKDPAGFTSTNQWLEVVGFPAFADGFPLLQEAIVRPLGEQNAISPIELSPEYAINEELHSMLVWMEGRVLGFSENAQEERLRLEFGTMVADAILQRRTDGRELKKIVPGSIVRLVGVYQTHLDDSHKAHSFQLLLRSTADVRVISRPSWWTTRHIYWFTVGGCAALALAISWIGLLHFQVKRKTRELRGEIDERKRLEVQLRQAQKMEAIGQLAGGVAHDFNNILLAILLHLGILQDDPDLPEDLRRSLQELEKEANRAAALTRQLLLFGRRQVMITKPLVLHEVLTNLLKMLKRLLGENIRLEYCGECPDLRVDGDAGMIEQVVMNLCVNARDAMPKGGQLRITCQVKKVNEEMAQTNPEARVGDFVCVSVADTGVGMDEHTLKRAFEPFFTTKDVGKGTGLGLATVYGIVKQHNGWVEVDSSLGRGTVFRVFLPIGQSVHPHQ